ncbi:MAG: P-loop NTPase, partial [Spirochaetes bacterium]|nr:P-loop NTPase [Spirochaetota bacterium]
KCNLCEACFRECRFDAVEYDNENNTYKVNTLSCEGCGVCKLVCKQNAVSLISHINGEWYISETRFGPMSHAKLGTAEENSGKLVSLVRNKKNDLAVKYKIKNAIIDGSPGTGCPVIASITGADYAVIVTEPTVSGIHDLLRILDVTEHFKIKSGVIINKYDLNIDKTREIKKIINNEQIDFLGAIPYDKKITEAQVKGLSIIEFDKDSNITNSIKEIWENIKSNAFNGVKV